jgi:uncharacterized protein (TIGR02145 family)
MKTAMKKLLFVSMAFGSFAVTLQAQGVEICTDATYAIVSTVDASGASTYQWLENGQLISGATAAGYTVPSGKAAGLYTYIRQAKSADCSEWQSSNEFTVTVFNCAFSAGTATSATATFTDPRDGKSYKTVVLPDGKTWFAQNLNYTKDLTANGYSYEANGKQFTSTANGVPAVGSYWCPPLYWTNGAAIVPLASGAQNACDTYGALYTWETAMMVDGKYADEAKTGSAWEESWVSSNYLASGTAPKNAPNADKNNARGATNVKGGGRGICPMSWHIPTELEWAQMLDAVEGNTTYTVSQTGTGWWGATAGQKLKSAATFTTSASDPSNGAWLDHANHGTNSTGFGAVPAGRRYNNGSQFSNRGTSVYYWSSSVNSAASAWHRQFYYSYAQVNRRLNARSYGLSVRCVKD